MVAGRPKKYNEPCRNTAFTMPYSLVDMIDDMASEAKSNRNEMAINIFMTCNKDLAIKLTKDINILREAYASVTKNYADLSKRLNDNTANMFFHQIEDVPTIKEFYDYAEIHFKTTLMNCSLTESELMEEFEDWLYEHKEQTVKNKNVLKIAFRSWLSKKQSKEQIMRLNNKRLMV
jgi:hypothetical protein